MNAPVARTPAPGVPTVLVFPVNLDASAAWIAVARSLGQRVLGASSEPTEDGLFGVEAVLPLPYITDPAFVPALRCLVAAHGVTDVFSAHQGVWAYLDHLLAKDWGTGQPLRLCTPSPHETERAAFARSRQWAEAAIEDPSPWQLPDAPAPAAALTVHEAAGLHRQFVRTPGQCDETKLLALCALARIAPPVTSWRSAVCMEDQRWRLVAWHTATRLALPSAWMPGALRRHATRATPPRS